MKVSDVARQVGKALKWAPENSPIEWRRRSVSDLMWYGLAFTVSGLGPLIFWDGEPRLVSIPLVMLGVGMLVASYRRAIQRRAADVVQHQPHPKVRHR
jgi:hypothetical protein